MLNNTRPDMDDVEEWNRGFDAYFTSGRHKMRSDAYLETTFRAWLNGWRAAKVY